MLKKIWAWIKNFLSKKQSKPIITSPIEEDTFLSLKSNNSLEQITCELKWVLSRSNAHGEGVLEVKRGNEKKISFKLAESDIVILLQLFGPLHIEGLLEKKTLTIKGNIGTI